MKTSVRPYTIQMIRQEMNERGSHWWSRGAFRFFRCRVLPTVYQGEGGIYFVSSEQMSDESPREYSIRKYDSAERDIETIGKFGGYKRSQDARDEAARLAFGGSPEPIKITECDPIEPPTAAEQLATDITRNTGKNCTKRSAAALIELAKHHQALMEQDCNVGGVYDDEGTPLKELQSARRKITRKAKSMGCTGVHFQGDPRGATVKLIFPNGATDDWGRDGWCVPTKD